MPRFRLLAVDIDGTLVNSSDQLSPATREALLAAQRAGIRVVLATGRRYSRALPFAEPLEITAPLVTASGALIKEPLGHRTLFQATFAGPLLRDVVSLVHELGFDPVLYGDTFADSFDFYCAQLEVRQPELAEYLARNPGCHRLWPSLVRDPPEGVFAGFVMGARDEMTALRAELLRRFPDALELHVLRSPRYHQGHMCEILPAGVSKWSGIRRLTRMWDIADHEVCAVGDDVSDVPMIEAAGLGVAMGNALDEVKSAADRIAPTHDEDGLREVVDWLLEE